MPFQIATFRQHLSTANANYSRHKDSSMAPLEALLATMPGLGPAQWPHVQPLWGSVPHAKQQKYALAGNYIKQFIPALVDAIPCKPKMSFVGYKVMKGPFEGNDDYPLRFYHQHTLTWESSNGHMQSLANVGTRENVTSRTHPASAPFHQVICGNIPISFTQGATTNAGADSGSNGDDHSIGNPALILRRPIVGGSVIADQVYEYTTDGTNWLPIPGAVYEIEKGVRPRNGELVFYFRKQSVNNNLSNRFHFEIEYSIGPEIDTNITRIPVWPAGFASDARLQDYTSRIVARRQ